MVVLKHVSFLVAAALVAGGCGTLAPEGGGAENLPSSGAGPYGRLPAGSEQILADDSADLADPQVFADGEQITIWHTRTAEQKPSEIRRARLADIDDRQPVIDTMLAATEAWETGGVGQPAVLRPADGGPWLLAYAAGGALGYAISDDGEAWRKAPGPALRGDGGEEGAQLASPALVRLDDGTVRLYYVGAGGVFAADAHPAVLAALAAAPFVRAPGPSPAAAVRALFAAHATRWLETLGRVSARYVETPAGRARYDLYLSGAQLGIGTVGLASSWDGTNFALAAAPLLDARAPAEQAATVTAWRGGSLLLFVEHPSRYSRVGGARSP